MKPVRKILLVRTWGGSAIAGSVKNVLCEAFPEAQLDVWDISRLVRRRPDLLLPATVAALAEFGPMMRRGKINLRTAIFYTSYLYRRIKELIPARIAAGGYDFSFMLQSLLDISSPGTPHFVYTDHTFLANRQYPGWNPADLPSPKRIELEKQLYQNATAVFTRSSNISRSIREDYGLPAGQTACVYAGSNALLESVDLEKKDYSGQHVLFVGIDWERKGGPEAIEAFRRVLADMPNARFTIVGPDLTLNLPNVSCVGQVPVDQVHRYFEDATVFFMPTRHEPFGVVFVEALSYGLPVIATQVGAIPDMVHDGQNGYLCSVGDVEGMARALKVLLSDPEKCRTFGTYGYHLARERYNWSSVAQAIRREILARI